MPKQQKLFREITKILKNLFPWIPQNHELYNFVNEQILLSQKEQMISDQYIWSSLEIINQLTLKNKQLCLIAVCEKARQCFLDETSSDFIQ